MDRIDRRILLDLMHQAGLAPSMGGNARLFEHHEVIVIGVQKGHLWVFWTEVNLIK
jgi:hypothetical protein